MCSYPIQNTHAAAQYAHPQALTDTQVLIPSASQEERGLDSHSICEAEEDTGVGMRVA